MISEAQAIYKKILKQQAAAEYGWDNIPMILAIIPRPI
jgi:hypothetical protein